MQTRTKPRRYFYPRPPRGGRPLTQRLGELASQFLSTPSARRATVTVPAPESFKDISIHALREEGDVVGISVSSNQGISIYALREEGDTSTMAEKNSLPYFYPRPPRGGRLEEYNALVHRLDISIHALREEGDRLSQPRFPVAFISIHALREEGDLVLQLLNQT